MIILLPAENVGPLVAKEKRGQAQASQISCSALTNAGAVTPAG